MSITAWDDRPSTADTGQHDDSGICPSCGHWFPQSEYTQEWRDQTFIETVELEDGRTVPMKHVCTECLDAYFHDDTCAYITADGSMELC